MTLSVTINSGGITAPTYDQVLSGLITAFQSIYGSDAYLSPDSQDGQLLAVFALAIHDSNQAAIAIYNSFSPTYAQGAGLSSLVKINGITRQIPTNSSANLTIIGQAGTVISSGVAQDTLGNKWNLPGTVTIPIGGMIVVTATAQIAGSTQAQANTINKIATPVLGWQSVNNAAAATAGAPVEVDAVLRARQAYSTSISALSVLDSLFGAIGNITGVQRFRVYENPDGGSDVNGIPAHSISVVTQGGDAQTIANTIAEKKTPGTGTYGSTSETVTDPAGVVSIINFYALALVTITCEIDITAQAGYVSTTGDAIKAAIIAYISALPIGDDVQFSKLYTVANLDNGPLSNTYNLTQIKIARSGSPAQADVVIAFNEAAFTDSGHVSLVVS